MIIRIITIIILGVCLQFNASSQEKTYELLWEISGNDFEEKSYVFGSMHLNDSRIFEFGDSLYYCISQCQHFTNEVNFDSIGYLLTTMDMKSRLEEEIEEHQNSENEESNDDSYDINGFFTVLDMQLFNTAKHLGLSIGGLEAIEDQLDLLDELSSTSNDAEYGGLEYENFIRLYREADLSKMEEFLTETYGESNVLEEDYDLINRNTIQANSIIALGKKQPTFSVVGAAHLFGENNVLDYLRNKNYTIRLVGFGKPDTRINEIYPSSTTNWPEQRNTTYGYKQESPPANVDLDLNGIGNTSLAFEYDKGLTYYTIVFKPSILPSNALNKEGLDFYLKNNEVENEDYKTVDYHEDETGKYYLLQSSDEGARIKKIGYNANVFYEQGIEGMSFNALDHPNVNRYLNSLHSIPIERQVIIRTDEENTFSVPFMSDEEYTTRIIEDNAAYEGGEVEVQYVVYEDIKNASTHIFRYHYLQPGAQYPNIYEACDETYALLSKSYNCDIKDEKTVFSGNRYTKQATCTDSIQNNFFLEYSSRGNQAILRVENTKNTSRNPELFTAVKYKKLSPRYIDIIQEENNVFSVSAPKNIKIIDNSDQDDREITWHFSDNYSLSTGSITLADLPRYNETDINDEYLKNEKVSINESVDSLISFDKYYINNTIVGYITKYMYDSSTHYTTDLAIYNGTQEISMNISFPLDLMSQSPEDEILESLQLKFTKDPLTEMARSKSEDFFNDLKSQDSTVFINAYNQMDDFRILTTEDLKHVESFLNSEVYDEQEEYNSKYSSINMLHNIEGEEVLQILEGLYHKTGDELIKSRILQSLAMRIEAKANNLFFSLLDSSKIETALPYYTYENLRDSTELFNNYKQDIFKLHGNETESENILKLFTSYTKSDSTKTLNNEDSLWLRDQISIEIDNYIIRSKADSSASPSLFIMDYFRYNNSEKLESKLYNYIKTIDDPYSNYLLVFNRISRKQSVDTLTISRACNNMNYYYYILELYTDNEILDSLPSQYLDKIKVAECIAINHWNEATESICDRCEQQDEINYREFDGAEGNAFIMKCFLKEQNEEEYYIGIVGNFDKNGIFDIYSDSSGYFGELKNEEDSSVFHQELIDYFYSEMAKKKE